MLSMEAIPAIRFIIPIPSRTSDAGDALLTLTTPLICGCQILIPSYGSRHARIFNVRKRIILKNF